MSIKIIKEVLEKELEELYNNIMEKQNDGQN